MDLLTICLSAFVAVFVLLGLLAAVMRLILVVFPHRDAASDAALLAAVHVAVQATYPDKSITNIEEIRR